MNIFLVITLLFASLVNSSKHQLGNGIVNIDPSVALQINTTSKSLLISRFSEDQKLLILNSANLQLVFRKYVESGFYFFMGSKLEILKTVYQLNSEWNATSFKFQIENKPNFSELGFSGDFSDLSNFSGVVYARDKSQILFPYLTADRIISFLSLKANKTLRFREVSRFKSEESKNTEAISVGVSKIFENAAESTDENRVEIIDICPKMNLVSYNISSIISLGTRVTSDETEIVAYSENNVHLICKLILKSS